MRTHGWGGATPASDDEAAARILDAAGTAIDAGSEPSIADVARTLGVTRQTVYRYFPSADALLVAAGTRAAASLLDRLATHLAGLTDPATAATEAVAATLEWLPHDARVGLLLAPNRGNAFAATVTSQVALQFATALLRRLDVDWATAGFTDATLTELAEHLLRTIQSFVIDPGHRRGAELRAYLRRWVAPAASPSAVSP